MSLGIPPEQSTGALTGYRVLSMCDALGVFCPKILADLGADVITIEPPEGASTRRRVPFYHDQADAEKSLYFWYFHTNTRSITLNLDTADGQELLRRLIPTADIFVETTVPGSLENYMGPAFRLSATPAALRPAPCLGQHNAYVYGELLGMSTAEIAHYTQDQVFY